LRYNRYPNQNQVNEAERVGTDEVLALTIN
jgi:hypothetical protein